MITEASTQENFETWKTELNKLCLKLYAIDTEDMGFGDDDLRQFWCQKAAPKELTEHFGSKYDLIHADGWMRVG